MDLTADDVGQACAALSRGGREPVPAVWTSWPRLWRRYGSPPAGQVSDGELRVAHDLLCAGTARYAIASLPTMLAELLLGRGMVPGEDEHGGQWWLWWLKRGKGPCQRCGQQRSLTRYSNMFGRLYRYLCARCRGKERAEDTADLEQATGVTRQPGESADSLLMRRLAAFAAPSARDLPGPSETADSGGGPSEEEWGEHVDRLMPALAGWGLPA